jgi:putative addiction module killer protein
MRLLERQVKVLSLRGGKFPFDDWFEGLTDQMAAATVATRIQRLRTGDFGDFRDVGEGVIELRIDYGPGYRVYIAQVLGAIVVLLIGGDTSTQERDIKRAQRLWKENRGDRQRFQRDFGAQAPE